MKKIILIALLASVTLYAADITITVSPAQTKACQAAVKRINEARIAEAVAAGVNTNTVQLLTALQYARALCDAKLDQLVVREKQLRADAIKAAYEAAAVNVQTNVDNTLGVP